MWKIRLPFDELRRCVDNFRREGDDDEAEGETNGDSASIIKPTISNLKSTKLHTYGISFVHRKKYVKIE